MLRYTLLLALLTSLSLPAAAQSESICAEIIQASEADLIARVSTIDLTAYPIVPTSTGRAREIFQHGQLIGRNPNVLSKVGDCNSVEWLFLYPFGQDQYDLGAFTDLQATIDHFLESFAYDTYAAHNGLNALAALDPIWANPAACAAGESPLLCEYRVHNPGVAVIMFGSNDILALTPAQFDQGLRCVLSETIEAGIVPVLSTFPRYIALPDRSILFNQIVVQVALDYDIPLINLWLALEPLPGYAIDDDGYHLNGPFTRAADFSSARNLRTGYPMRNLVTLQTLDVIRRTVIDPDS